MNLEEQINLYRFTGSMLDAYLALGYYRMYQEMFTTKILFAADLEVYRVFWLRTLLSPQMNLSGHSLFKKNKRFDVEILPAENSYEIEALYQEYKSSIDFETADNIQAYIFGDAPVSVFDCMMIQIRDHGRLIAVGFFDKGKDAIAGIMNFYDPDYKKHSLGRFLMLLKMQYALQQGMHYYYTGYIAMDYDKFDYKIFPDPRFIEVYIEAEKRWIPFPEEGKEGLRGYDVISN